MKVEASVKDKKDLEPAFTALEKEGKWIKPEFGSVWIHYGGPDQSQARTHTTIAVPNATTQSLGLPDKPTQNGAWIMNAGSSVAHIMVPGS